MESITSIERIKISMNTTFKFDHKTFHLNWDKIGENFLTIVWQLFILSLIFFLISRFGKKIIDRYLSTRQRKTTNKRTKTITALINSIFQYTVIFFYLFGVLSIIGVPIGTLLASAGIFSLALGMGAQGFVSDLVNGFFILSEDQFDVGDTVEINSEIGTVIQLGLRTTRLRASDGSVIYIPNRNISIVQNLAHNAIGMTISLELDANNNFEKVYHIIEKVNKEIKPKKGVLTAKPSITGVTGQNGQNVTYGIYFKVKPEEQSSIKNLYMSRYIEELQKNNINFGTTAAIKDNNS